MLSTFDIDQLHQFSGSEQVYKHGTSKQIIYTEGIRYLAKEACCYWLLDEIALMILPVLLKKHPDCFYLIKFVANADGTADIVAEDGNDNVYVKRYIELTDFPVKENLLRFYLCESDNAYCLMLPGEY